MEEVKEVFRCEGAFVSVPDPDAGVAESRNRAKGVEKVGRGGGHNQTDEVHNIERVISRVLYSR